MATKDAIYRSELSGRYITDYLTHPLFRKGYGSLESHVGIEAIDGIKRKAAYDQDYEHAIWTREKMKEEEFELPDGQTIRLGHEEFDSPPGLFAPSILGLGIPPIHSCLLHAINRSGDNLREELSENGVLVSLFRAKKPKIYLLFSQSGGNTLFPGFAERFQKEYARLPSSIRVAAPADRQ